MDTFPLVEAIESGKVSLAILLWVVVRLEILMYTVRAHGARIETLERKRAGNDVRTAETGS